MKAESIKIVGGALALRRFTLEEIVLFCKVNPSTASSWLSRNRDLFVRDQPVVEGVRGRPRRPYILLPNGVDRLSNILSSIPSLEVESAFADVSVDEPARLDALPEAEAYYELLTRADEPADRASAAEWLEHWLDGARHQRASFEAAGRSIAVEESERLAFLQRELEGTRATESQEPEPRSPTARVWEVARRCISHVEAASRIHVSSFPLEMIAIEVPIELASVGVLAALGLARKLATSRNVRRSIHEVANQIDTRHYLTGLKMLSEDWSGNTEVAASLLIVIDGIRQDRRLIKEVEIKDWLSTVAQKEECPEVVLGACTMALLTIPSSTFREACSPFVERLQTLHVDDAVRAWREQGQSGDRFAVAVSSLGEEAIRYCVRTGAAYVGFLQPETSLVVRFQNVFMERGHPLEVVD